MTTYIVSPPETIYDEEGAVLLGSALTPPPQLVMPYLPIVSPENFTDYLTPQGGSYMWFG